MDVVKDDMQRVGMTGCQGQGEIEEGGLLRGMQPALPKNDLQQGTYRYFNLKGIAKILGDQAT